MLRLHPPVPVDIKQCVKEDVWPDGTVIPPRSSINYHVYGMGRDPDRWPEPLALRPERWIEMKSPPTAYEFPVFQAGPRICLGLNMASIARLMLPLVAYCVSAQPMHVLGFCCRVLVVFRRLLCQNAMV